MFVNPLEELDDIDNLFNTDDLAGAPTAPTATSAFKNPSEDLKEQVRRVVKDPAALQELCEMFSSQGIQIILIVLATCKEFMEIKEKIAIAIIKENSEEIPILVAEAKIKETCKQRQK
jgi:hypothetical protein